MRFVKTLLALAFTVSFPLSLLAACDEPRYVENNGVEYYDANDVATDTLPSGPYTKGGQYVNNPDEATNTRDNRGDRPTGYGHDVNQDFRYPARGTYPAGTVVYGDGTVVYPNGTIIYANGNVVYPPGANRTTVITPSGSSTTTTTTRTTVYEEPGY